MGCKHERLRTVGDRVFCCECNEEVPLDVLLSKNGKNSANNPSQEAKTDKASPRKRAAKKAV